MSKKEQTGGRVSKTASSVLRNPNASPTAKSLAGSALAQTHTNKTTSTPLARTAAKVLDNPRSSTTTKRLAGSVLTQKPKL